MNNEYIKIYADFFKKIIDIKRPIKIVFDCSNGAAGLVLKRIMNNELGIRRNESRIKNYELRTRKEKKESIIHNSKFIILNSEPDGNFPAHGPDPMAKNAIQKLAKEVKKQKVDAGVIFDADGDRVFFTDNKGRLVDSDEIGYILMKFFKPPYVIGVNSGCLFRNDKNVIVSRVGHYFYKKLMRDKDISFGFERSGHYYFKDFFYCDSGIFAALKIMEFVSLLNTDFSDYLDGLPKYFRSGEANINLRNLSEEARKKIFKGLERHYDKDKKNISRIDGLTIMFGDWWFNARFSNTENLLRLNIEAGNRKLMEEKSGEVKEFIKSII